VFAFPVEGPYLIGSFYIEMSNAGMVIPNQSTAIPTRSGQVLRRYKDEEADRDRRARVEWGKIGEFAHRGIADGAFDWIEYALQSSRRGDSIHRASLEVLLLLWQALCDETLRCTVPADSRMERGSRINVAGQS
jgi:hypothetical protein